MPKSIGKRNTGAMKLETAKLKAAVLKKKQAQEWSAYLALDKAGVERCIKHFAVAHETVTTEDADGNKETKKERFEPRLSDGFKAAIRIILEAVLVSRTAQAAFMVKNNRKKKTEGKDYDVAKHIAQHAVAPTVRERSPIHTFFSSAS
jgi:hypothetical protein